MSVWARIRRRGEVPAALLVDRRVMALVLSVLVTALGALSPVPVQAQTKRLEMFMPFRGDIYYGDIFGVDVQVVPRTAGYSFTERPAVVSDQPGRLWLASMTSEGYLAYAVATNNLTQWQPARTVPGTHRGGVCTSRCYTWASAPAISSWGPGRLELFILATRGDGAIALMHTWGDNGQWSGRWESLGTGSFSGSPTAVSWGPGYTDVFVQSGGGPDLAHKWFAAGRWSAWESLGGIITASPSATSMGPGHLDISVRGPDNGLWHRWFLNNTWSDWEWLGKPFGSSLNNDGPVAAAEPGRLDIIMWSGDFLFRRTFANGWENFTFIAGAGAFMGPIGATYWVP